MLTTATRSTYEQLRSFALFADAYMPLVARGGTLKEAGLLKVLLDEIDGKASAQDVLNFIFDHWVSVASATNPTFSPAFGYIYSVDTTAADVTITLPNVAPTASTVVSFYDPVNTWGSPNKLIINTPAGQTLADDTETQFETDVPGNGRLIHFTRPEDINNPGTYATKWVVQRASDTPPEVAVQDSTDQPSALQYKFWIEPDTERINYSVNSSWNLVPGFV